MTETESAGLGWADPKADYDLCLKIRITLKECDKKALFIGGRAFSKGRFGLRKKKHSYSLKNVCLNSPGRG